MARCLAFAVLGAAMAVAGFAPATVHADPSVSPFAGTYVGGDPAGWDPSWDVEITNRGKITSSYSFPGGGKRSIHGQVSDDGSYSFTVSVTVPAYRDRRDPWSEYPRYTVSYESAGSMEPDLDGNIAGTTDDGGSFTWLRQ